MTQAYRRYLILRYVPIFTALLVMGIFCITFPTVVLWAFKFNAIWTSWVAQACGMIGDYLIAPLLPNGVWAAFQGMLEGIHKVYVGFVLTVHAVANLLPLSYGPRVEVLIRGYLAEGWLVILEIAAILRFYLARRFE